MTVLRTAVRIPPVEAAAAKNAPFAALSLRHKGGGRSARRAQFYGLRRCAACRSRTGDLRGAVRCSREYAPVRRYAAALAASRGERPFCADRSSEKIESLGANRRQRPAKAGKGRPRIERQSAARLDSLPVLPKKRKRRSACESLESAVPLRSVHCRNRF